MKPSNEVGLTISRIEMMFSWLNQRKSLISRRVRRQNMEWSNGVIFLIATLDSVDAWIAEHTTPYAPSPTTSTLGRRVKGEIRVPTRARAVAGQGPAPEGWCSHLVVCAYLELAIHVVSEY